MLITIKWILFGVVNAIIAKQMLKRVHQFTFRYRDDKEVAMLICGGLFLLGPLGFMIVIAWFALYIFAFILHKFIGDE